MKMNNLHALTGNKTEAGTSRNAMELERTGAIKEAAALYRILLKHSPNNLRILNRMMIVYRKLKDAVNEIKTIDTVIRIQEQYYNAGKNANKKTIAISKQLNLLLGHTDKKGKAVFKSPYLMKLEMRKQRLQLKKPASAKKKK